MSDLADYRVVSICTKSGQGPSYCVEENKSGKLLTCEPVDYGLLSDGGKKALLEEVKRLVALRHSHLVSCEKYLDQNTTGTIYLMKEHCGGSVATLIKKCQTTNSFVDEAFIWKIVYQTARAAQAMYSRGPPSVTLDITTTGLHLNHQGDVKVDYWLTFREKDALRMGRTDSKASSERRQRKGDSEALGRVAYTLASLQSQTNHYTRIPPHYSQKLKELLDLMVLPDQEKRPAIEAILYHPSLMSHVVTASMQQLSLKGSHETVNTPAAATGANCARCSELEAKVEVMKNRQANIKAREIELKEKERAVAQRGKHVSMLEQLAREKLDRAENYLSHARRDGNENVRPPDDLDSSCYSADPGDTIYPTTIALLDPNRIRRPSSLAPSVYSRRSVQFDTITELDETENDSARRKWLENKRNKFKATRKTRKVHKSMRSSDKENERPQPEQVNTSIISLPHSTKETRHGLLETFFR